MLSGHGEYPTIMAHLSLSVANSNLNPIDYEGPALLKTDATSDILFRTGWDGRVTIGKNLSGDAGNSLIEGNTLNEKLA